MNSDSLWCQPCSSCTRSTTLAFLEAQGYVVGHELQLGAVAATAVLAVAIGTLAAALPAWLTARAPLADALSYE